MRAAQDFVRHKINVSLFCSQFLEDRDIVPDDFLSTPDLERSILDVSDINGSKRLPLLKDILDRLYGGSDAEYLVYTNVDIALMPHFYLCVAGFIMQGYDAFTITKRVIRGLFKSCEEIPLMYAELGERHGGFDCFVFHRDLYPQLKIDGLCIGALGVGVGLLINLIGCANKFNIFRKEHLTFHIGDAGSWKKAVADNPYNQYNLDNAMAIAQELMHKIPDRARKRRIEDFLKLLAKWRVHQGDW